jgi:hypothetical protein
MRKTFFGLLAAVAVALTISSPADAGFKRHKVNKPVVAGVIVGTVVAVGLYVGWFGSASLATASSSAAGAATIGAVAGIGTVALVHAAITPCTGFHALLGGKGCKNGKYVGR